eukprot:c42274_g1_i1 orf=2-175(-)
MCSIITDISKIYHRQDQYTIKIQIRSISWHLQTSSNMKLPECHPNKYIFRESLLVRHA